MKMDIDRTLYNQIKARFPAIPGVIQFISITGTDVEKLTAISFNQKDISEFCDVTNAHCRQEHPYAFIGSFEDSYPTFVFISIEFTQEEDLSTGRILEFEWDGFREKPIDIEAVKRDLKKLGSLLSGNA